MQVSSIITMEDTPELRLGVRCVLLQLFEHNENAYRSAVQMMEECGKAAIVHPTGTGKSYIAFKLIEEHPADTIFWLSPSEYIFKTQIENLKRQAPDISLANVHFYTYAKLMCCATEELEAIAGLNPTYIILDEFHRVGAECWGASTLELLKLCPDAKILGLSATNIRYLDNNRDMAEELFDGHIASEMTLGEAIVRGILPAPKYVTTVYQYQKELTRYQNRIDNLRSAGIQDVNTSIILSLWAGIALCFGIKAIDTDFIPFFFGKGYMRCAELLEWLSIVIIIKAISNILRTQYLIPMEKDKEFNISVIVAAIVNVILNYILIPTYGAMGAVIGTLVAETIVLFLYAVFSKCVIKFDKVILPGMLFVIAGIVMNMVVDVVKDKITINSLFLRLVVEVCIGGLIYCVLTFVGILLIKKPQKTLNL